MSTVDVETERVMVVPTQLFHDCGYFQGFSTEIEKFLPVLLNADNTSYLPRGDMEQDPSFKQLIPYCIFRFTPESGQPQIFQYTRGKQQGEARLHSKRSIGIGGHISTLDIGENSPYEVGMNRELEEEIEIGAACRQECVGLINDDENEVGKVHLGIVHIFDIESPQVTPREDSIADAGFVSLDQLLEDIERFETWSQICVRALFTG